jgi:hypothetical protein
MVVCNAVLIVTAFGLYYFGSETLRPLTSDVHIVVGLALPFLLALHIWLGRKRAWNALVPGLGQAAGRLDHDPEKACPGLDPGWIPVFRKDHAPSERDDDSA